MEVSRWLLRAAGLNDRWRRVIGVGYTLLLTYLLLCPEPGSIFGSAGKRIAPAVTPYNVAIHAATFTLLTVIWIWASRSVATPRATRWLICALAYGVVTELLQFWVPNRFVDWRDFVGNSFGCLAGWWIVERGRRWLPGCRGHETSGPRS